MAIKVADALQLLQDEFGPEGLEQAVYDSACPGVCMSCSAIVDDCEPDACANYCDECSRPRVKSWMVLAGVI